VHKNIDSNPFLDADGFADERVHMLIVLLLSDVACLKVGTHFPDGFGLWEGADGGCWESRNLHDKLGSSKLQSGGRITSWPLTSEKRLTCNL
jgi:hypothetical protein